MATYRLFDGLGGRPGNGPASPTAFAGNFLAGTGFSVTAQMMWLNAYYWWVPPGGDTGPQKFALWNRYASNTQSLVPGSVVTSGTLTAGAWNLVPLPSPVQLAPGAGYVAATGWVSVNGFPDTQNQYGTGQPLAGGVTNGPLVAWSDPTNGGTNNWPTAYAPPQGLFSAALGSDPSVNMPNQGSNSSNFWVDVLVSDTAPAGYTGSFRVWPNMGDAIGYANDTATNFTLGMEFTLSQACAVNNIWFYSPAGVSQLPTEIGVFKVSDESVVASNSSPSWSGATGSGWVKASLAGTLQPGTRYKAAVLNGAGTPGIWNAATALYWSTGFGASGLTAGPITVPNNATATAPGQETYNVGATFTYPLTNAGPFNYWVDIELTPVTAAPGLLVASFP